MASFIYPKPQMAENQPLKKSGSFFMNNEIEVFVRLLAEVKQKRGMISLIPLKN